MSRSYLFVPGDSDKKLGKAADSQADALIIDLEDSVRASARPGARALAREFLARPPASKCWVRINPLGSDDALSDLRAVMPKSPYGIVLPKAASAETVRELDDLLSELEKEHGADIGATRILPIVTERPGAIFRLGGYAGASERLHALTWGAEDLSAAVGASTTRDESGHWLAPYQLARTLTLFAAAAAEVAAIETVYTEFRDLEGLAACANAARRDGFSGMLAIHPAQVDVINAAFLPSAEEIALAERIVAAFRKQRGAGVVQIDGAMVDRPHYLRARRILAVARDVDTSRGTSTDNENKAIR